MDLPRGFKFHDDVIGEGNAIGGSVNLNGRWGNRHVKVVDSPEHLVETGVSRFLTAARVPHQPVSYSFRDGEHLVHAPWLDAPMLQDVDRETDKHIDTNRALHTLTAQWLAGVADRHSGNYLIHPEHGAIPIDFGMTAGAPPESWGRIFSAPHQEIFTDALLTHLRRNRDLPRHAPLPPGGVAHLKAAAEELRAHYHATLAGFDKAHAEAYKREFERRLKHLTSQEKPTLAHLLDFPNS